MKMKNVLLLLANGFEIFEASVFIDILGWNLIEGTKDTKLFTCGMTKEVISTFNIPLKTDLTIDEVNIDDYEALAIPGGFEEYNFYSDAYNQKFLNLIKKFYNKNKIIASICVGALPIGKSGILSNKKGTTFQGARQKQLKEFNVEIIDQPIVIEDNIITSWNPSTATDVAFKLLELLTSKDNSNKIKSLMGFK